MKQTITMFCLLLISSLTTTTILQAQGTIKCSETASEEIEEWQCYPKSEYSEDEAKAQFEADMLTGYSCDNSNCRRPALFNCSPAITSSPNPRSRGENWCFKGTVKWKCTDCTRIVDKEEEEPLPEDGFQTNEQDLKINIDQDIHDNSNPSYGHIESVFPNPSSGVVRFQLRTEQEQTELIEVFIHDLQGKQLRTKQYRDIPASLFNAQIDLTDLAPGIYLMTTNIDGIPIGTNKIVIQ